MVRGSKVRRAAAGCGGSAGCCAERRTSSAHSRQCMTSHPAQAFQPELLLSRQCWQMRASHPGRLPQRVKISSTSWFGA
jgi:hypothetical protein